MKKILPIFFVLIAFLSGISQSAFAMKQKKQALTQRFHQLIIGNCPATEDFLIAVFKFLGISELERIRLSSKYFKAVFDSLLSRHFGKTISFNKFKRISPEILRYYLSGFYEHEGFRSYCRRCEIKAWAIKPTPQDRFNRLKAISKNSRMLQAACILATETEKTVILEHLRKIEPSLIDGFRLPEAKELTLDHNKWIVECGLVNVIKLILATDRQKLTMEIVLPVINTALKRNYDDIVVYFLTEFANEISLWLAVEAPRKAFFGEGAVELMGDVERVRLQQLLQGLLDE